MPLASPPLAVYAAPQSPAANKPLPIPWYGWDQNEWCWAACAQMLAYFFQHNKADQCTFATQMFGHDCCQNPSANNFPLAVSKITEVFPLFGKSAKLVPRWVEFAEIQTEIAGGHPVQIGFTWNNGNNHVAVVAGAAETDQGQLLYVNDPDPEFAYGWCKFTDVRAAYGRGSWQWTWMPIR